MRAFVVEEFGTPGSVQQVEDAKPEKGELLVRVKAAGVNPVEAGTVAGYLTSVIEHRFPLVPGVEFSGEVVEGAGDFAPGDEVYGSPDRDWFGEGTWSELLRVAPRQAVRKPPGLSHAQAASVPTAALTALEAIEASGLGEGATLAIVGATGGVGSFATQLAARRGIRVIAVGRGENAEYARELGAAETIDYTQGDVAGQILSAHPGGVDGLFDTHSDTDGLVGLATAVREGGAVISPKGAADPDAVRATGREGINANRTAIGRLEELNRMFESGDLVPVELKTFPLEDANEALAEVASGHVRGKLALTLD